MVIRKRYFWTLSVMAACGVAAVPARAGDDHGHGGDIVVARTQAGQLTVEFDFGPQFALPAVQGVLNGWAADDPGLTNLESDEPGEGLFALAPGAHIVFEVVSFSPGLKAWRPGLAGALFQPGDQWVIGPPDFDVHPVWHLDADDPLFDPLDGPWMATFRLLDAGATGYAPSADLSITFVPEPTTAALLLLATMTAAAARRRGRKQVTV